MQCPHCSLEIHYYPEDEVLAGDTKVAWGIQHMLCPACDQLILYLLKGEGLKGSNGQYVDTIINAQHYLVWPKARNRPPRPIEVPQEFAEDYNEACMVVADSPKASAALSRRCLQHLLRQVAKVKPSDLANEIQQVIDSKMLPSQLVEEIDAVRNIGNFAAHPMKSKQTGEILPVEPEEAEWNLEVLESLFDFYFVQPAKAQKRRDALNAKLKAAGKPPMK